MQSLQHTARQDWAPSSSWQAWQVPHQPDSCSHLRSARHQQVDCLTLSPPPPYLHCYNGAAYWIVSVFLDGLDFINCFTVINRFGSHNTQNRPFGAMISGTCTGLCQPGLTRLLRILPTTPKAQWDKWWQKWTLETLELFDIFMLLFLLYYWSIFLLLLSIYLYFNFSPISSILVFIYIYIYIYTFSAGRREIDHLFLIIFTSTVGRRELISPILSILTFTVGQCELYHLLLD